MPETSLLYVLAAFFFNAFPLPQREAGARRTLRYIGDLLGEGWSLLIYPEGERTDTGRMGALPAGHRHDWRRGLPCRSCPSASKAWTGCFTRRWQIPRPGRVRVVFGAPLRSEGEDYAELARTVETAVRQLG